MRQPSSLQKFSPDLNEERLDFEKLGTSAARLSVLRAGSMLAIFCALAWSLVQTSSAADYPKHWWEPVPREGAPEWEILPQDAGPGEVILSKRNELGIFSNFAATPFVFDGIRYASLEGFWQSMKYPENPVHCPSDPRNDKSLRWKYTRDQVAQLTAFEAKKAGDYAKENMTKLGITWLSYNCKQMEYKGKDKGAHYDLIYKATWAKVKQNPKVRRLLRKTGDLVLRPDHTQKPNSPPAYQYFEIYMKIRKILYGRKGQ